MADKVTGDQTDHVVGRTSAYYATPTTNCCGCPEYVFVVTRFSCPLPFRPWSYSVFLYCRSVLPATSSPGGHDISLSLPGLYYALTYLFVCFFVPFVLLSVNASGLLAFVCRTCRTQYDGTSFHFLLCLLHY